MHKRHNIFLGGVVGIALALAACAPATKADRAEQFFSEAMAVLADSPLAMEDIITTNEMGLMLECGDVPELTDVFEKYEMQSGPGCSVLMVGMSYLLLADLETVSCEETGQSDEITQVRCTFTPADDQERQGVSSLDIMLFFEGDQIVDALAP